MLAGKTSFPGVLGLEGTVLPLVGPGMTVSDSLQLGLVTVTLTGLLTGLAYAGMAHEGAGLEVHTGEE